MGLRGGNEGRWCRRKEVDGLGSRELRKLPSEDRGIEDWGRRRRFEVDKRVDQRNWAALRSYRRLVAVTVLWHHFSKLGDFSPAIASGLGVGPETMDGRDFAREVWEKGGKGII